MQKLICCVLAALCCGVVHCQSLPAANNSPSHSGKLILVTEEYPPFNMSEPSSGALQGISVDKVTELMRRAKQAFSMNLYPWTRAYQMGLQMEETCVFSTTRTPEREALFHWIGPLVRNNWTVFARADDKRNPKSIEEIRPYLIGGYQSDAVGEHLKQQGFEVDLAVAESDNPRKLLLKRFDFWASGELLGAWLIRTHDYTDKIRPLFNFKQTEMYLACHPKMALARVEHFNQILRDMVKDGSAAAIEKKYR